MNKLIWTSDIHLNFLGLDDRISFYDELRETEGDKILITGDIAEAPSIAPILANMADRTGKKIYFVAGNHDYYGSSIKRSRAIFKNLLSAHYLPKSYGVKLNRTTVLVGQDGWGDGRNGDFEGSQENRGFNRGFTMADWFHIEELQKAYLKEPEDLLKALQRIADKDAERLTKSVLRALKDPNVKRIILATHVPPFAEACLHAGRKSTEHGLAFFSSQILGVSLLPIIEAHPEVDFLWLCGHTHSNVTIQKRDNFVVRVAHSEYYHPQISGVIDL